MTATSEKEKVAAMTFPAGVIEAQLRQELLVAAEEAAALSGASVPSDIAGKSSARVQIDSLVVVEILCTIEPIVGFELEDSVVRAGGYESVDEALKSLIPRIAKEWHKRKGTKK